ncbi:acetyl-CoA C-acetyltransferase [Atopostipes suicloacalis DSM 15692]|uniref:acetyl-CoA C-acetyltransferase n=1 Tax=Atopostipes suicloacalis DSM 15692 TaxID=1121025 RepID=A0A1M4Z3V7_9LACT|nr:acetyl-CoA C-acetyltransferase [Atopostipes suicloacalis]SHF12645.1 acetyl-CoA C-acetyltransferase [Atopostipes suicloacalis DSM 15692]
MERVFIVGARRTAIGSFLGALSSVSAAELGAVVTKSVLEQAGVSGEAVEEVVFGNALPAGQGQGVARQIAISSGIPASVPASGVNMVCGSGLKSVMNAYVSILVGMNDVMVAGGVESMSQAPHLLPAKLRKGQKMGDFEVEDYMLKDGLTDAFSSKHMGVTAENIAEKYNISREAQDAFAFESQQKAIKAQDAGAFVEEIVPVTVKSRYGEEVVDTDEYINRSTSLEKLAKLRPAFKKEGTVTAGNASGLNDGASAVLIVSESYLKAQDLEPLAEIVSIGQGGVDPDIMGMGPVSAIEESLRRADLSINDLDVIELNEAFAAQSIGVVNVLAENAGIDADEIYEKTNRNGGAIALGHPIGASGNRVLVTLLHLMKKRDSQYGLASLCIGGGMGVSMVLKKPKI